MFARRRISVLFVFLLLIPSLHAATEDAVTKQDLFIQNEALEQRIKTHITDMQRESNEEFLVRASTVEQRVQTDFNNFLLLGSLSLFGSILFSVFCVKLIDLYFFRKARKPIIKEKIVDRFPNAPQTDAELVLWHQQEYWRLAHGNKRGNE